MPATGNEAVTLAQLRTATGSTGGGSATGGEAVTIAQAAQALGATPTGTQDVGGLAIRLSQLKTAVEAFPAVEIVPWSTGTDEQIAAMVAAADAGQINLSDYWSAGDTRTVQLSAMAADGVGESHAAQSVQFVLSDPGHYTLANGKPCNFVVLQKNCLNETGYMNSSKTNNGGWNGCARRTWCNNVFRNAVPSGLRGIFKQFTTYAASRTGSTSVASSDYFALFSEKEVFGSTIYADRSAEANNSQLGWFKTYENRIKRVKGRGYTWWERSLLGDYAYSPFFCSVNETGGGRLDHENTSLGLAPFGCI